jgi:hypothetical protein
MFTETATLQSSKKGQTLECKGTGFGKQRERVEFGTDRGCSANKIMKKR